MVSPKESGEANPRKHPYHTVAVVGVGLIGGSLALALRRGGHRGRIVGVSSEATLREARSLGIIDDGFPYDEMETALARADLVVLAGPISVIMEQLATVGKLGEKLRPGLVVTDVGSTKRAVLRAATTHLPGHVRFIGGHPLAGSEQRGVAAADPFLFQNAYYVLTPAPDTPPDEIHRLGEFLGTTGARMMVLGAEEHDHIAATISHVPQLLAVSLVQFLESLGVNREHGKQLAAGGFRDMTRIASSPYSVWRDIIATNRDVIRKLLDEFLESTRTTLKDLDDPTLDQLFASASTTRGEIPRDTKGFLTKLWDVLVVVEDQPGVIVGICGPLAEKDLNVMDIEVLKVREGEGGTLRLAFRTREIAEMAIAELIADGYQARLRE